MQESLSRYIYTPTQDPSHAGRVILLDGSTAELRRARPTDQRILQEFFQRLSLESRAQRFFTASPPSAELIASLCREEEPGSQATLLVLRRVHGDESAVIATGTFSRRDASSAEVAFAVDDVFRGKGLGTVLLERLALLAVRYGIRGFWAVTRWDNSAMRDVFQAAGFPVRESLHAASRRNCSQALADNSAAAPDDWTKTISPSARPAERIKNIGVSCVCAVARL